MSMAYHALLEKKERGCPIGFMQGVVYDTFVKKVDKISYGYKPWYNASDKSRPLFPGEMFLISKDKLIAYDLRHGSEKFHIVSSGFFELLRDFQVPFEEVQPINIVNSKGISIAEKDYYILSFGQRIHQKKNDVLDAQSVFSADEYGHMSVIEKLIIKPGIYKDFFKIQGVDTGQDVIFCSEKFMEAAIAKKVNAGIAFMNIEDIPWSKISTEHNFDYLLNDTEPLLFIH
jgi:hypothetical protein